MTLGTENVDEPLVVATAVDVSSKVLYLSCV